MSGGPAPFAWAGLDGGAEHQLQQGVPVITTLLMEKAVMRRMLIPALAGGILALYGGVVSAQGPGGREGRGGGPPGGAQPSMRGPGPGPGAAPQRQTNAPRAAPERPRVDRPARAPEAPRSVERRRQAEPQARPRAAERERAVRQQRAEPRRDVEQRRNAQKATERERSRAAAQSEQRRNAERKQNAERAAAERERTTREGKQAEERQRREPQQSRERQATDRPKDVDRVAEGRNEMRLARERLGPNERQKLRQAFDYQRARVTKARFAHRVGHRIPRNFRLFAIPAGVISFFPYYRDYRYVVVDDEICIVDPRTYEIVDVIDQDYYRESSKQEVAGLSLTEDQIALVRDSIPRDFPQADLRLRLALGAELPRDVELYEFPALLLDRIPKLRDYRFLVAEDQIVIVDPRGRAIALVIDRV